MTFRPWLALGVMAIACAISAALAIGFVRSHSSTASFLVVGVPAVVGFVVTLLKQRRLLDFEEWFSERPSRRDSLMWAAIGAAGVALAGAGVAARALVGGAGIGILLASAGMLVLALVRSRERRDLDRDRASP